MTVLRTVTAHFETTADTRALDQVNAKLNQNKASAKSFSERFDSAIRRAEDATTRWAGSMRPLAAAFPMFAAGLGGTAVGAYALVTAASNAQETLNALRQTFKESAPAIEAWGETTSREFGRAKVDIQEAAKRFGAFMTPSFDRTAEGRATVAEYSMRLTELAFDLSSFYDLASDEEAFMRLESGLAGETEAVRRLGIDLSDTALNAFALETGMHKQVRQMTLAEKTTLRFNKIMKDTADKQGDIARTGGGWANQVKTLKGQVKDLAAEIGEGLIPEATEMIKSLNAGFKSLKEPMVEIIGNSTLISSSFYAMGIAAGATGLASAVTMFSGLADKLGMTTMRLGLMVAAWLAVYLIVDDLKALLSGDKSVTGELIKTLQEWNGIKIRDPFIHVIESAKYLQFWFESFLKRNSEWFGKLAMIPGVPAPVSVAFDALAGIGERIGPEAAKSPEARLAEIESGRRRSFEARARAGNFEGIRDYMTGTGSAAEQANQAMALRREELFSGRSPPSKSDVEYGVITNEQYRDLGMKLRVGGNVITRETVRSQAESAVKTASETKNDSTVAIGSVTIRVDGSEDPKKVAEAVWDKLQVEMRNAEAAAARKPRKAK